MCLHKQVQDDDGDRLMKLVAEYQELPTMVDGLRRHREKGWDKLPM